MPNAVFQSSNVKSSLVQNRFLVTAVVALANVANTVYNAGGVPFTFAGLAPSTAAPDIVFVKSFATGGILANVSYEYTPGTTNANGKIQIFAKGTTTANTAEITGNVPQWVIADTIVCEALIPKVS